MVRGYTVIFLIWVCNTTVICPEVQLDADFLFLNDSARLHRIRSLDYPLNANGYSKKKILQKQRIRYLYTLKYLGGGEKFTKSCYITSFNAYIWICNYSVSQQFYTLLSSISWNIRYVRVRCKMLENANLVKIPSICNYSVSPQFWTLLRSVSWNTR